MEYFIGIDSGATSTDVVVACSPPSGSEAETPPRREKGARGMILARDKNSVSIKKFKPINYNLFGPEKSADRLSSIIKTSIGKIPLRNIKSIAACIAGTGDNRARKKLKTAVSNKLNFKRLKLYPDVSAAFASAFDSNKMNCGVLIAGTGSVLYYRKPDGKYSKAGGWGRHIGDEGSGWWIAREALASVTRNFDGRGKKTRLEKILRKKFRFTPQNIVKKIYHDNFELPKLTALVFACAAKGDHVSKAIIRDAAAHLARHLEPIKNSKSTVALCGSLFSEQKILEQYLKKISKQNYPGIKFIKPNQKPVFGALKLAMLQIPSPSKRGRGEVS